MRIAERALLVCMFANIEMIRVAVHCACLRVTSLTVASRRVAPLPQPRVNIIAAAGIAALPLFFDFVACGGTAF